MAVFGIYYTVNMLRIMKWPRKKGIRGKEFYDVFIVDQTVNQMADWAASIGAGMPHLAAQLLAHTFRDVDWNTNKAPDIEGLVNDMSVSLLKEKLDLDQTSPHDLLKPFQFGNHFKGSLPSNAFENVDIREILEQTFIKSLLYGLSHPQNYENWYKNYLVEFEQNKELYKKMDMGVDELPSLKQSYVNAKEIIDLYQKELEIEFPPIPEELRQIIKNIRK